MSKEKKGGTIKIKDYQLNSLKLLLSSLPRELLFDEKLTKSCENKWQALTKRNKILKNIEEVNKDFEENVIKKLDDIIRKYREESKAMIAEFDAVKDSGNDDEKKKKVKEKTKFFEDLNTRQEKEFKELGYIIKVFNINGNGVLFVEYEEESKAKEIELELDADYQQVEFIKEQFERNIYNLPVSDEILADLAVYFI